VVCARSRIQQQLGYNKQEQQHVSFTISTDLFGLFKYQKCSNFLSNQLCLSSFIHYLYIFTRCLRQLAFYSLTLSFRYLRKTTVAFGRQCTTHHHHHSPDFPYCPKINQHHYLSLLVVSSSLSSPSIYVVVQAAAAAAHARVSVPGTG
jgi:hypothetical protein